MLDKIINAIGGKSTLYAVGAVGAIAAVIIGYQHLQYRWLKADYDTKQAAYIALVGTNAVCEANTDRLTLAVDRQNLAIERLQAENARMDAERRASALLAQKKKAGVKIDGTGVDAINKFFKELFQ